jgi:hypothetical protein
MALLLLAAGAIASSSWWGVQLMVNPQSMSWVNRWLPGWIPPSNHQIVPQSVQQIRVELRKTGQQPGELIPLGRSTSIVDGKSIATDWLMPVVQSVEGASPPLDPRTVAKAPQGAAPELQKSLSPTKMPQSKVPQGAIVALRVYQQAAPTDGSPAPAYHLVTQLLVTGLEESFVIAPLVNANSTVQGSSQSLPLRQIHRYESKSAPPGYWLNLSGQEMSGGDPVVYGQIVYYNAQQHHLGVKLNWTSPAGEMPLWKSVTGDRTPELVVNQTVGLEPQFDFYRVQPLAFAPSPVQLQPVSLAEPALDDAQYAKALLLARAGLWSSSEQGLISVKRQLTGQQWNPLAQAQLDLVHWHAQATASQANSTWANPSQQALVNLVDGRWEPALTVFDTAAGAEQELTDLLKTDQGRIENRIQAALDAGIAKPTSQTWMLLLIAAQKGKPAAIAWLKTQRDVQPEEAKRLQEVMQRLVE